MISVSMEDKSGFGPFRRSRPQAPFLLHGYSVNVGDHLLFTAARDAGFRCFAVPWFSVQVNDKGTFANNGFEQLDNGVRRPIDSWEEVSPRLVNSASPGDVAGSGNRISVGFASPPKRDRFVSSRAVLSQFAQRI